MGNIHDIKRRIGSVTNTRQITNAMKMVAASNLRKAQERIIKARPYANYIDTMLRTLKMKNKKSDNSLLSDDIAKGKQALVIITADRGLCGAFNSSIIREALIYAKVNPQAEIVCVGKKGLEGISKKSTNQIINKYIGLFNEMDFSVSKHIAEYILDLFLAQGYAKIDVLYNEFKSAIQQNIITKQLLPIVPLESDIVSQVDFLYEPDEDTIIYELAKKYTDVELWRIMLESSAAEQGARMTAMDSATENATDMIKSLTLQYNRERQAAITTEILEISSGAEAINQ